MEDEEVAMDISMEVSMEIDNDEHVESEAESELDCYPYTFTPLLLFAQSSYFDKGYSNYNSVAQFFSTVIGVDMLENVLYERKNMLYEELLDYVTKNEMLVTCCIDAHFTAFQVLNGRTSKPSLIYYDPLRSNLKRASGDGFTTAAIFLLLKCNYGDSQHIQEHKAYYTGIGSSAVRRTIYQTWQNINTTTNLGSLHGIQWKAAPLNLNRYLLINDPRQPKTMSTQQTSNTCYFQTFLFAVLCKVGECSLARDGTSSVNFTYVDALEETTLNMSRFLLEFFVDDGNDGGGATMRPLTNSNFVLDFYRYKEAPYHATMTKYLKHRQQSVPDYELQYHNVMQYFVRQKCLHKYEKFTLDGAMSSTPNTKSLQYVVGTDDAVYKLARSNYYKFRPVNLMFGFNAGIMNGLESFSEFNSLRKNQLLRFYESLKWSLGGCSQALSKAKSASKYRDYYFMPQFEVGQQELIDVHHFTFLIDHCSMISDADPALVARLHAVNRVLVDHIFFSTQKQNNYNKLLSNAEFKKAKKYLRFFLNSFMSIEYLEAFVGLGFAEINPKEKELNSLTQTVFYSAELMGMQANKQSYDFEKECINQMARSQLRKYCRKFEGGQSASQKYKVSMKIGLGYTYSKYNTLMHFLNVAECYWNNPDLTNIQVLGKDIRALLVISCQKIFFEDAHSGFYHYGPFESSSTFHRGDMDLAVASSVGHVVPGVSQQKRKSVNQLVVTDRVFEFNYLKRILEGAFSRAKGIRFKSDNEVLNLCLLSLMLDFGLFDEYCALLHLPFLQCLQHEANTQELQVEVANLIYEFDRRNTTDSITRSRVEELIFEASYKFLVNKDFPIHSKTSKLICMLNADPNYQSYVLLCKIYMSLCQINKSVEVDYYKVRCDGEFRIIIPQNFSRTTSEYLDEITKRYTFSEKKSIMVYDELPLFDLRPQQPEINLHKVRFDSATAVQSMVKYIEIGNALRVVGSKEQYLVFIADNVLNLEVPDDGSMTIWINKIAVEVATIFFNEAISFVPCFKYAESEDVVLFTSPNIHYLVDKGGQFCTDYYGMKHEVIECIKSEEGFVDLNDEHVFKSVKLSQLLTESKTVIYFPDYLLQVTNRQQLISLLDLAVRIRNVSFFILALLYLRRGSVVLEFVENEGGVTKLSGPWKAAILYVLNHSSARNEHYDAIFGRQFFDLNQHKHVPLVDFIEILCENFTKYQRFTEDNEYQIVPRPKQKAFLKRIICAEECFHFSEVGSGKTKVILPLLCQIFLSNNEEAHKGLARGGKLKDVLVILVPEHLVADARTQVYRYCLNLNFREEYRVYDDIFALLHRSVRLGGGSPMKQIFVTSFNQFKKALTNDIICDKVRPHREHILVVADEVDDFLDRNKLVFNICSNKSNSFDRPTLDLFFEVSRAAYRGRRPTDDTLHASPNPDYWKQLFVKFSAIHAEIQDASRSINKSFGIFNEYTLRHCSTNIVHDTEGYKSLIARPYESVNRAMPGSYYSDVERTIYLTYVILSEDIAKYDELFQGERKFISFEYWSAHFAHQLDFDDLVYGHERLSEIVLKHPETKDGISRFLYEIILRRMEIRDKSRSVNSIDVIFNFDCIGFTGTPFLDNYPTFDYIRNGRKDGIPNMIDRSFYAYTSDALSVEEFEERFARFQGQNNRVLAKYVSSDFINASASEMATLEEIFAREERSKCAALVVEESGANKAADFNTIVDLCGIFKQSSVHDVRDLIRKHFGPNGFLYIYHIDQTDSTDRVLCVNSDNDVQYDEEFYKYLCKTYGKSLREKIFFFVDNRNVIGKDIPFQLVYQRRYRQPLLTKSAVLAHDVDDFSKIWQAMGRSRTMNETLFSIYKTGITDRTVSEAHDIKKQELTRRLYVRNCDCKMAGNISSIYLTLVALYNLSQESFYYCDEIVNTFIEKMERTIAGKVALHEEQLARAVLGSTVPAQILLHMLVDKCQRSSNNAVATHQLTDANVEVLLRHIVQQKFELRVPSGEVYDDFIIFLSGEHQSLMEISYTKQQQKQKQKQQNKNQDNDVMGVFDKKNQLKLSFETEDYFKYTMMPQKDLTKIYLNLPSPVPILAIAYDLLGSQRTSKVYPTLQFLYSHHIHGNYISPEVHRFYSSSTAPSELYSHFLEAVEEGLEERIEDDTPSVAGNMAISALGIKVLENKILQNPQYTIAALKQGAYIIGMKDQFNIHDIQSNPLQDSIQYIADEMGLILFDKTTKKSVNSFGPYSIDQYILMEVLSKQEVAHNVMDYYCNHKDTLQRGLEGYDETQGKGFVCWRFIMNKTAKSAAIEVDSHLVATEGSASS